VMSPIAMVATPARMPEEFHVTRWSLNRPILPAPVHGALVQQ
jgi:hypothetical protein